ncbi:carbohydrate-binding module family 50 protein [Stipitochalara longipes BDJ]|nr:carbohydrate-binding module family 50 protein [Stipitochalara longipes BDJ]
MLHFTWTWALFVAVVRAQLILYNSSAAINSTQALSTACTNAMIANISCPIELLTFAGVGNLVASDNVTVPQICSSSCTKSLASYHKNISTACAHDPAPWPGIPATWPGDIMWAYANRTCLTNATTGKYCVDEVLSWWNTTTINATLLSNIPTQYLCTKCMLGMLAQSQSTSYSNYNADFVSDWQSVQAGELLLWIEHTVQPPQTNLTIANLPNFVNTSGLAPVPCISGKTYRVKAGDNCTTIGISQKVASGTLFIINNLFADCSNLTVGSSICLPQTCSTYQVKTNDTCWSVAAAQNIGVVQLQGWNPALNPGCSNLYAGTTICISPPGGIWNGTTIAGASPTQLSPYATTTVTPPGPTPFGTTSQCGAYYEAVAGDYCQQISLNQTITVNLFEAINPSINANCTNLSPGFYYCVYPTFEWNSTSINCTTLTAVAAPAPTTKGTISPCYSWYKIQSGDTCSLVETEFGISFSQLQAWNTNLNSTCGNLVLGDAYCVNGQNTTCPITSSISSTVTSKTTTSSTSTTSSGVSTPTPHQPNMVSGCTGFYEAVSGDTCSGIATKYSIALNSFYTWNPDVGTTCSALWANEWYCVAGPTITTTSSSTKTTSTGVATPTPHQPNMVSGCKTFYEAVSGDTCSGIATKYSITLSNFYTWNPDVGTSCSALWANEWYCVGM